MHWKNVLLLIGIMAGQLLAQDTFTYTTDADFGRGLLLNVHHDQPDRLQLNQFTRPLPFLAVTNAGRGTMARINTTTGEVIGEYRTAPQGLELNPSRATVDLWGNAWAGNRNENSNINGTPHGSVVKIGIVSGGTRVSSDGSPNANGGYLSGPFVYNTCRDRDGDGLIRTSHGLGDVLDWVPVTDGLGGADGSGHGIVQEATDECVLVYQRTPDADGVRHISIDRNNDVWVGGYPEPIYTPRSFLKLAGDDGQILDSFDARPYGAGGYGGLVDSNGVLWSVGFYQNKLLRYDPLTGTGSTINVSGSYGLGIDSDGFIWNSMWFNNSIMKIDSAGVIQPGFPKPTGGDSLDRGVAVTPSDNHVWVANSGGTGGTNVSRLDNNGNLLKVITVGTTPTGMSVDSAGKVWVINRESNNLMRIDPIAGADGLGAVDLTVDMGAGAGPYNYSDATGIVALGNTARQGGFAVVQDGGQPGLLWEEILWNTEPEGAVPPGTSITVEARAGDNLAGLPGVGFVEVENGVSLNGQARGRYLEVRATLRFAGDVSPVLSDLLLVALPTTVACDFSGDGLCDVTDLDLMQALGPLVTGLPATGNEQFDLNNDGTINLVDRDQWLAGAAIENNLGSPYKLGDADLDGTVDEEDFAAWRDNKFTSNLLWSLADFNADGFTDGRDVLLWNSHKFTSSQLLSVPEPTGYMILVFATLVLGRPRRRN